MVQEGLAAGRADCCNGTVMTPWKELLHSLEMFSLPASLWQWINGREDPQRRMARGLRHFCRQYQG